MAELRSSPDPTRWSVAQIVAHLADAELVFAYRLRSILASPGTAIAAYDQNHWSDSQIFALGCPGFILSRRAYDVLFFPFLPCCNIPYVHAGSLRFGPARRQ